MTINKLSEYGHSFQIKVLASLLLDKKFLQTISDIVTPDFFDSEAHKWIIQYTLDYFAKFHSNPTLDVLSVEVKKQKKESLKVSIIENLREVYTSSPDDIEYVQEEFFNFCKNQALKGALLESVELLNEGNFEEIRHKIDKALKSGRDRDIGHNYNVDVDERFEEEGAKIIEFPWKVFNDKTDGGLGGGDLMLIFAPPGIGKTTAAACIVAHALKQGKNVLFYALEINQKKMGQKIDSILTGIPVKELRHHKREVKEMMASLPGRLIIKAYPPKKASLETLRSHARGLMINEGFVADLKVIDYPELLRAPRERKEMREETDDVFTEIKGDAMEENIPYICPSQINRSGAKDRIIEGDKVSGTYGKMMIGDFNISISRLRKDKINNFGVFLIIKSRLGPDGLAFGATIDLSRGYIDISEEEYDETQDAPVASANGNDFDSQELKEMRSKFHKFTREKVLEPLEDVPF